MISLLTTLNGSNNYFTNGLNELVYVRISSGALVLVELNSNINRQLFGIHSFQYSVSNPFNFKLVHNDNAFEFNIDAALLSVGYNGTVPIRTLDRVFNENTHTHKPSICVGSWHRKPYRSIVVLNLQM